MVLADRESGLPLALAAGGLFTGSGWPRRRSGAGILELVDCYSYYSTVELLAHVSAGTAQSAADRHGPPL
jgi:hypothetical protein